MNKRETVQTISDSTGISTETCIRILDSLEEVSMHEMENIGGISLFFNHIYRLKNRLERMREKQAEEDMCVLARKIARSSGTRIEETQRVLKALADLLNHQLQTSKSARFQYRIFFLLIDFFRHT